MDYAELRSVLLGLNEVLLSFPFDDNTAVFKVSNKMFALVGLDKNPLAINLKCDPDDALLLRSQFDAIAPGYHMNKEHWNTITMDGSLDDNLVLKLIEDSYWLVIARLSKKEQVRLGFVR